MEQMRIKHNETGRSMVEMLGVLAVVGVLSIGGVAGYRYAVDKMNANEIINELKKRAITASQQRVLGQDINLSEYGNNGAIKGYTVTPTTKHNGNASQFALEVQGVPERVCDMILESDWALPTEKVVNGGSCVEGANGNTLTFAFNNTLGSGEAGNGGNNNGNEGNNDPTDTPIQQCGENEYRLADGTCKEDTKCTDPNQFWNSWTNQCELCPTESNSVMISSDFEDTCLKCSNAVPNMAESGYFYCVNCPVNRVVCGQKCCESNQGCQVSGSSQSSRTYECVPKVCTNDSNCVGKLTGDGVQGKAICDTFSGQCVWGCKDNNDCLSGQFCNLNEESTGYGSNAPRYGVCESATLFNNGVGISVGDTTVYRSLKSNLTWWDAQNFCKANNMNLFNLRPYCENEWNDTASWTCSSLVDVTDNSNWSGWTGINFNYERSFRVNLSNGDVFALYLTTYSPQDAETAALCE